MPQDEKTAARERRLIRKRANQMQRALAAVLTDVDALGPTDRLIVLNDALVVALRDHRRSGAQSLQETLVSPRH